MARYQDIITTFYSFVNTEVTEELWKANQVNININRQWNIIFNFQ